MENNKLLEQFGCYTFNDNEMKKRLPEEVYNQFHESLDKGESLSTNIATVIAKAMK